MNDAAREVGGALGIAVLGSILNGVYRARAGRRRIPDSVGARSAPAEDSLPAALAIARQLGEPGAALADAARDAFAQGMVVAFVASAGLLVLVAAALAALNRGEQALPGRKPEPATVPSMVEGDTEQDVCPIAAGASR